MIISASRRTDIPAFYLDWFINRLKAGEFMYRNPMFPQNVSTMKVTPETVDCIVFWTKNGERVINRLNEINSLGYEKIMFQYTITGYDGNIEKNVPNIEDRIFTFKRLSQKLGQEAMTWRYDPIMYGRNNNGKIFDEAFHIKYFEYICRKIAGHTQRCVFSFLDLYSRSQANMRHLAIQAPNDEEIDSLVSKMSVIANEYGIELMTCSEPMNLSKFGIAKSCCIDSKQIGNYIGYELLNLKDKGQRKECGCIESVDVGMYNCCLHDCVYCYATYVGNLARETASKHDKNSPLLLGNLQDGDVIKERIIRNLRK